MKYILIVKNQTDGLRFKQEFANVETAEVRRKAFLTYIKEEDRQSWTTLIRSEVTTTKIIKPSHKGEFNNVGKALVDARRTGQL